MGERIVTHAGVQAGDEVIDVGCGTGNAALPAAATGARVVGLDITPELLEVGRRNAAEAGVEVEWVEGDAEELPYDGGELRRGPLDVRLHVRAAPRA